MGANQQERRGLLEEHQVAVNWSERLFFPLGAEAGIPGVPAGRPAVSCPPPWHIHSNEIPGKGGGVGAEL